MSSRNPKIAWEARHRLARINPIWILLGIITLLAAISVLSLANSGAREGPVWFLGGLWLCALAATWFYVWKHLQQ